MTRTLGKCSSAEDRYVIDAHHYVRDSLGVREQASLRVYEIELGLGFTH